MLYAVEPMCSWSCLLCTVVIDLCSVGWACWIGRVLLLLPLWCRTLQIKLVTRFSVCLCLFFFPLTFHKSVLVGKRSPTHFCIGPPKIHLVSSLLMSNRTGNVLNQFSIVLFDVWNNFELGCFVVEKPQYTHITTLIPEHVRSFPPFTHCGLLHRLGRAAEAPGSPVPLHRDDNKSTTCKSN